MEITRDYEPSERPGSSQIELKRHGIDHKRGIKRLLQQARICGQAIFRTSHLRLLIAGIEYLKAGARCDRGLLHALECIHVIAIHIKNQTIHLPCAYQRLGLRQRSRRTKTTRISKSRPTHSSLMRTMIPSASLYLHFGSHQRNIPSASTTKPKQKSPTMGLRI